MAWPKGKPRPKTPGSGIKKGQSIKRTALLKDMILQALDNKGGPAYLEEQAEKNPAAFLSLVGKVLPLQITGADGGAVKTESVINFVYVTGAKDGLHPSSKT